MVEIMSKKETKTKNQLLTTLTLSQQLNNNNGSSSTSTPILADQKPQFLFVKMNQTASKSQKQSERDSQLKKEQKEIKVKVSESTCTVSEFVGEDIIRKHMSSGGSRGKSYPGAKLYSKNGVELDGDDILYMKTGDIVYLARHGEAFNYQQVMDRYEKIQLLGSGGFGKVYLMRDKEKPDQLYAVKIINMSEYLQKADGIYEIDREAKTLRMLNSKYIIQLDNYFIHGQKEVILVMEYAQGGELKKYVNRKGGVLSEFEVMNLMKQIITGLSSCHQRGIIHRDLKLENVLFMDKECTHLKIVDFGIAGFCLKHLKEKTDSGTFKYMAPEVLKGDINLANPQMDIWALGIMMFTMLFGFHPFLNKKERQSKDYDIKVVMQRIINDPVDIPQPTLPVDKTDEENNSGVNLYSSLYGKEEESKNEVQIPCITPECRELLFQLLCKNPKERIQLIDAQTHPWFSLSQEYIQIQHQEIYHRLQEDELHRQEKLKKQFQQQLLHKRNTLHLPMQSSTFGVSKYSKTPMGGGALVGAGHQLINGNKKLSNLSPLDLYNKAKINTKDEEYKKGNRKQVYNYNKKISQFDLNEPPHIEILNNGIGGHLMQKRQSVLSPLYPKNNKIINNIGFEKKQ
eukprot:403376607